MVSKLDSFTDFFDDLDEFCDSQPLSLTAVDECPNNKNSESVHTLLKKLKRPEKGTGQVNEFRSVDEIDAKYRNVFSYPFFNLVQSRVIDDALYSDKSMVVCAPTGSGKTVVFEMAIVQLLMQMEDRNETHDFKIIYMAPVKALCTERLTEWYPKFTRLGLLCIEVTGDTDVDFSQLKPYRIIITTPEKWDMLTRRWRDHRQMVELIKLFLIDEVHILNDATRGPVLEAVVSRMKTIETSVQSTHRIEQLQQQYQGTMDSISEVRNVSPCIRFVAVSATVSNPEDVAAWLGTADKHAVYYKFGDECRPVKLKRVVEGYSCSEGTSIFKFDLVLNYKLWPIIQKYHNGKPTLIFCNTRKSVTLTAETLSKEITITFNEAQKSRLTALASTIKNKKLQVLVLSGVGCHHAGLLYEERTNIEQAFRNRDLPILITTTTLAMGVNLPAHLVIIKNTQQYINGAYQEYSISTILQMVGRAGRPQFDTEATAVIMTRFADKHRYQALVGGSEPLQSYLHKRLPENLNSEAALGTVGDVAQCVQWLRSTFLSVRAAKDPKRYLGLQPSAPHHQILKKIEELCVKAMNSLASTGLITMDEACCIESTEAGRLMSIYYLDLETMKHIMKIEGSECLEKLLWVVCESHELSDMHLRTDERRCLNALNRNNAAPTVRYPMKGKIGTRQMKLNCVIQAILGCLPIPDPSLNQEATKIMRIADRVCKCLVAYVTRPAIVNQQPKFYSAILNSIILAKCVSANLWENSPYVSKQLKGIGPTFSTLLATAGKSNFMLLEESHPRDLERIMNKGPPAGNVLRKQIGLYPKYQLTMTPIDEKTVSVQLVLLNGHDLLENMDDLTAGASHKCYMVIGDSDNVLLHLSSFVDKDLLGVYDSSIELKITRKHDFEHKIYAHCVSATIAGLDARCEYVFKSLEQCLANDEEPLNTSTRQTTITDTFRERKRKNTENISQSKEKKKRENVFLEKLINLKDAFGKTSKVLKDDLNKSAAMSQKIIQDLTNIEKPEPQIAYSANVNIEANDNNEQLLVKSAFFEKPAPINEDGFDYIDDDSINNILNEIECEIAKGSSMLNVANKCNKAADNFEQKPAASVSVNALNYVSTYRNLYPHIDTYKSMQKKRMNKNIPKRSNYDFIDLLEKNVDLSDAEDLTEKEKNNSFSDAIRSLVEKYLQRAKSNVKPNDKVLTDLIQDEQLTRKEAEEPVVFVHNMKSCTEANKNDYDETMQTECFYDEQQCSIADICDVDDIGLTNHVTVLENKIKSIDVSANETSNININDQVINVENELPAVNLHKNTTLATENTSENRGFRNINDKFQNYRIYSEDIDPENGKSMDLIESMNIELAINQSAEGLKNNFEDNTPHTLVQQFTQIEPQFIKPQEFLMYDSIAYINPSSKERQINLDPREKATRESIEFNNPAAAIFYTQTTKHNRDIKSVAIPNTISSEFNHRHEAMNAINNEIRENDTKKVITYNNFEQEDYFEIEAASKQLNRNKSDLPKTTKDVSNLVKNTKTSIVEQLWKTYIKEIPYLQEKCNEEEPLPIKIIEANLDKNQKYNIDDRTSVVEHQNSFAKKIIEDMKPDISLAKTKAFFIPPFKYQNTRASESLTATQHMCNEPSAIINKKTQDSKNPTENKLPVLLPLSNIYYNRPVTDQTRRLIPREPRKDIQEIKPYGITNHAVSSQLIRDQQINNYKLPFVMSNTINRLPELQVSTKQELPETIPWINNNQRKLYSPIYCQLVPHFTLDYTNNNDKTNILDNLQIISYDDTYKAPIKIGHFQREPNKINNVARHNKSAITNRYTFPAENNDYNPYTQDQYVNKYSFSTSKVDVSTKEVDDHVVRVIRKMRVDLDVTEIVSKEKKPRKSTGTDAKEVNNSPSNFVSKRLRLESNVECDNKHKIICNITSKNNDEANNKTLKNTNVRTIPDNSIKPETPISLPLPSTHVPFINSKQNATVENNPSKKTGRTDHDECNNTFSKFKIESDLNETKPNNVESILQKYSNIMRNNTDNAEININQFKVNEEPLGVTKKKYPKRPFKISEINRLKRSLTGVLIDIPKPVNVTECFNLLEPDDKLDQIEHNRHQNICDLIVCTRPPLHEVKTLPKVTENIQERIMQNGTIIDDLAMPYSNTSMAHIGSFKVKDTVPSIDQNMFNPKTLLQCFSNDEPEDLIPPPPGYCDFNQTNANADESLVDCYEPMAWEELSGEDNSFNDSQVELTPSEEIETWSLSQDEDGCASYASPGQNPFSFTIMRKNKHHQYTVRNNLVPNDNLPRRNKLNQFKYNQKSKLKAKW